jgi:hypothetical protein
MGELIKMSKISEEKEAKIMSEILQVLYSNSPKTLFTADVSKSITRDEEFIKRLLEELESKKLVVSVKKNSDGIDYKKRTRWRLSEKAYSTYKSIQEGRPNQLKF